MAQCLLHRAQVGSLPYCQGMVRQPDGHPELYAADRRAVAQGRQDFSYREAKREAEAYLASILTWRRCLYIRVHVVKSQRGGWPAADLT